MRSTLRALAFLSFALAIHSVTSAATPAANPQSADRLVSEALQAEVKGNLAQRAKLLAEALKADPNHAPARWQSGFVRVGDRWQKAGDAQQLSDELDRWHEYLSKRDKLVDTADNHRELAKWCRKNRLPSEERLHWTKVLEFESDDVEALEALRLKWHDGRMLTPEQIAAEKKQAGERLQALRQWRPRALKWRAALTGKSAEAAAAARRELVDLRDLSALPALEGVLAVDFQNEKYDRLNLALIEVVDKIPHPDATQILLRRSVNAESLAVRKAACDALRKRSMSSFVPQLIAAIPDTVKTNFRIYTMPNGTVLHEHEIRRETQQGTQTLTYQSTVHPTTLGLATFVTPRAVAAELWSAAAIERVALANEEENIRRRERLRWVLHETTGFDDPQSPELWRKQYAEYYGWSAPPQAPEQKAHIWQDLAFFPLPQPKQQRESEGSEPSERQTPQIGTPRQGRPSGPPMTITGNFTNNVTITGECFVAGTPVHALSGPVPIESIKAGDRVLSQDLRTGELAYKTVQGTTLRSALTLVKLRLGDETITATYGHPFWVVGRGWHVAGKLKVGDKLRGLTENVAVEAIEKVLPDAVYNLLIDEYATFFVGASPLLVHDDSPLEETSVLLPGLAATEY